MLFRSIAIARIPGTRGPGEPALGNSLDRTARNHSVIAGKLATLDLPTGGRYHARMNRHSSSSRPALTWFVSRHAGAIEWARLQNLRIDRWVTHLDLGQIEQADTVIGTLPVNMAAEVCDRGALYLHLAVNVPAEWRGRELSTEELDTLGARIVPFHVRSKASEGASDKP